MCGRFLADTLYSSGVMAALWAVEPHADASRHHAHMLLSLRSDVQSTIFSAPPTHLQTTCDVSQQKWRGWYVPIKESAWRRFGTCRLWPMKQSEYALLWYVLKYVTKQIRDDSPRTAYPLLERVTAEISETFIKGRSTRIASRSWTKEPRQSERDLPWGIWTYHDTTQQSTMSDEQRAEHINALHYTRPR